MGKGTPAAEVSVDLDTARALLADQHPDLAALPLRPAGEGWDNAIIRLGDSLALRMPRRDAAARLIEHEQRWLPELAPVLPIDVPAPTRVGEPGGDYPYRWSIVPWLEGRTANRERPADAEAERLGAFLAALHVPSPPDAPRNPVRGVPLEARRQAVEERLARLAQVTSRIDARIDGLWRSALAAPIDVAPTWLHGDLHPRNVLVSGGRLSAVIDWGDVAAGDRATDLAAIWMLFEDRAARERAIDASGPHSEATLARARGWAVFFGAVLLDSGLVDHPAHAEIGDWTLRRVADDA
jgi:aminoglycoside phosphotransferase (APT) family kinase protein